MARPTLVSGVNAGSNGGNVDALVANRCTEPRLLYRLTLEQWHTIDRTGSAAVSATSDAM